MTNTQATTRITTPSYLLGHADAELRRLEDQARILAPATATFLTLAGIGPGMRVLDLGTGAGDVAFLAAGRVGASGSVVGIDSSPDALGTARRRADRMKVGNVSFEQADVRSVDPRELGTFDAVVGRLVLLYVDDPADVVRRCARALRPGGVYLAMEYDMTVASHLPPQPLSARAMGWILEAFGRTGHDPVLGARLRQVLAAAGLGAPVSQGAQAYLAADDPAGPRLFAETIRTLLPAIVGTGIASADEVGIETLEARLMDTQLAAGALMRPPVLVGAWGRRP